MELIGFVWENVVPFVFVLTVLVFVHELGHYWVARRSGVRVEVFSIGFGPEIYGWNDKAGTRWKVSAIPLGGYVKMFGEADSIENDEGEERELTQDEKDVSFAHKGLLQRIAIVAAGPLANFALAIVLFAGIFGISGSPRLLPFVATVQSGSAAESAGLLTGDEILRVDDEIIHSFNDLRRVVSAKPGITIEIVVLRDGAEKGLSATPLVHKATGADGTEREIGLLGVSADSSKLEYIRSGPGEAVWKALEVTVSMSWRILEYLGQMIVGSRPSEELGGPLRIAQMSAEVAEGGFVNLINFMALLSINLGLINLFPIPMLDGGHLVFFFVEAIRGRPLTERIQEYGFRFGLFLVLLLMVFATWNDLVHHFKVLEFLQGLGI
ncbi:MAG: RIP metalloprotease RseP [Alphaproteobacteria bacterium]|nr:RIP metalloprotease RseP [Alphaproteobacteria bacterium]MBL6945950.1 RIP metalloprotease RseP [Rhodospirillales bacterium]